MEVLGNSATEGKKKLGTVAVGSSPALCTEPIRCFCFTASRPDTLMYIFEINCAWAEPGQGVQDLKCRCVEDSLVLPVPDAQKSSLTRSRGRLWTLFFFA